MRFSPTDISGALLIEIDAHQDERGLFARTFCQDMFKKQGIESNFTQCNVSLNYQKGTLRGMHCMRDPFGEAKLVRATQGRVYDVAIDLRPSSPTYLKWAAVELDAKRHNAFYIPEGCAHGFLTLEDNSELFYQMSKSYVPGKDYGVRWNDPTFNIIWPLHPLVINERDANYSDYDEGKICK
ncbi:dTDP-4-dehydrorhamnose 3,5-epimerase [Pectobacteriaceae bacterium CE70]|nr:dTDP-4-dehydrorhamnose 3,5-epimerase [Pectobacteriaceae bacterium CE70]WJY12554.1 dTDP-4-dehydrorhamnose 3,5-epimerase [Pectobacteriaceae bacterium C80]